VHIAGHAPGSRTIGPTRAPSRAVRRRPSDDPAVAAWRLVPYKLVAVCHGEAEAGRPDQPLPAPASPATSAAAPLGWGAGSHVHAAGAEHRAGRRAARDRAAQRAPARVRRPSLLALLPARARASAIARLRDREQCTSGPRWDTITLDGFCGKAGRARRPSTATPSASPASSPGTTGAAARRRPVWGPRRGDPRRVLLPSALGLERRRTLRVWSVRSAWPLPAGPA